MMATAGAEQGGDNGSLTWTGCSDGADKRLKGKPFYRHNQLGRDRMAQHCCTRLAGLSAHVRWQGAS
jgi:hypothetical protein